jgi:hypothetical protein
MNVDYLWKITLKTAAVGSIIRPQKRLALVIMFATSEHD